MADSFLMNKHFYMDKKSSSIKVIELGQNSQVPTFNIAINFADTSIF